MKLHDIFVVTLLVLLVTCASAQATCEQNLAATAEYGSVLREQQDRQQREIAILRAKLGALEAAEKKAAEKPADKPTDKKDAKEKTK